MKTRILSLQAILIIALPAAGLCQTPAPAAPGASPPATAQTSLASEEAAINENVRTQTALLLAPEKLILEQVEVQLREKYKKEVYIPPSIQSLIFTLDQQSLLREARSGFNTMMPTDAEEKEDQRQELQPELMMQSSQSAIRTISLGGIVFTSPDDWTIWLNKKLVTSLNMPKQAVDLRVYKDFIELRWFDAKTNKIFPIRLRPNQIFNLDAQTFIPG